MSLGYIGIYEMTKLMKGVSHTTPEGHEFALKVMKHLRETTDKWKKKQILICIIWYTSRKFMLQICTCG